MVIKMTKDNVLAILKKENSYISGEKISEVLGISRTAVNNAVKALRLEGYDISSSTNKGYCLNSSPDKLSIGDLMAYLPPERIKTILCLDTVDSTNKRIREMSFEGAPEGQIVIANEQTSGRGRMGRSFASPKDKGIYLSMLLRPKGLPAGSTTITAWTAVAVSNAIHTVCGIRPGIKWVNDLVLNSKKLCGILTEMSVESEGGHIQHIIIGIGLNVNEDKWDFPQDIQQIATSLSLETGSSFSRAQLAAEIIKELDILKASWPQDKQTYLDAYRRFSVTVSRDVRIIGSSFEKLGVATAINDDFSLAIKYEDGTEGNVSTGEVSVRGLYDYV